MLFTVSSDTVPVYSQLRHCTCLQSAQTLYLFAVSSDTVPVCSQLRHCTCLHSAGFEIITVEFLKLRVEKSRNTDPRTQGQAQEVINSQFIRNFHKIHKLPVDGIAQAVSDSLRAERYGDRIPVGARFSLPVQTGPGSQPASYTTGTVSFPGVNWPGRGVDHPPPSSAEVKESHSAKIPTRCSFEIEFIIPKFIEGSTCFERHTAHHQELQTVLAASRLYTHVVTGRCQD